MTLNCPTARLWRPPRGSRHSRSGLQPRGMEGRQRLGGEPRSQKTLTLPAPPSPAPKDRKIVRTGKTCSAAGNSCGFFRPVPFASLSKSLGTTLRTSRVYSNSASTHYGDCLQYPHRPNGQLTKGPGLAPPVFGQAKGRSGGGSSDGLFKLISGGLTPAHRGCAHPASRTCGTDALLRYAQRPSAVGRFRGP